MFKYDHVSPKEIKFHKKLSYTDAAVDALRSLINAPGRHLAIAPTGSGKTYTTINLFKQEPAGAVCVIAVPTRSMAQQVACEYSIPALVGDGQKLSSMLSNDGPVVIAAVYDKIEALLEAASKDIHLVVDEAQQLICARDYRSEAIRGLENVEDAILSDGGSVVHITATPHPLFSYGYADITSFVDADAQANADATEMLINRSDKSALDFFFNRLLTIDGRAIVRLNNKNYCRILKQYLIAAGRSCEVVCSEDKEMVVGTDGVLRFKNNALEDIVHLSKIPDVDFVLTTSLLDAGINIVSNDHSYNAVFCVADQHDADVVSMEQFFARLRFRHHKNIILYHPCKDAGEKKQYHPALSSTAVKMDAELNDRLAAMKAERDANLNRFDVNRLLKSMQHRLLFKDGEYSSDYYGCISAKKEKRDGEESIVVSADRGLFAKRVYDKWMNGYYPHPSEVADALQDVLLMPVVIQNITNDQLNSSVSVNGNIIFEADQASLKRILDNGKLPLLEKNDSSDPDIDAFLKSSIYGWLMKFVHLKVPLADAVNIILEAGSTKDLQPKYDHYTYAFLCSESDLSKRKFIAQAIKDGSVILAEQTKHDAAFVTAVKEILTTSRYIEPIRALILRGKYLFTILPLQACSSPDDLIKYVEGDQYETNNDRFIAGEDISGTPFGRRQAAILAYLTNDGSDIKPNKCVKRIFISEKHLNNLTAILNSIDPKKVYTNRMTKNLIKKMFICRNVKAKGVEMLQLYMLK